MKWIPINLYFVHCMICLIAIRILYMYICCFQDMPHIHSSHEKQTIQCIKLTMKMHTQIGYGYWMNMYAIIFCTL